MWNSPQPTYTSHTGASAEHGILEPVHERVGRRCAGDGWEGEVVLGVGDIGLHIDEIGVDTAYRRRPDAREHVTWLLVLRVAGALHCGGRRRVGVFFGLAQSVRVLTQALAMLGANSSQRSSL